MTILKQDVSTLGALNASTPVISIEDADDIAIALTGTFVGTITFYASLDNVIYYGFALHQSSQTSATTDTITATAPLLLSKKCAPFEYFKAIMTAYTSGSAIATITFSRTSK